MYAHSIKNPEKMHFVEKDGRYLCIKACSTTPSKSTTNPLKVTCKRCLGLLEKKPWINKTCSKCPNDYYANCPYGGIPQDHCKDLLSRLTT